MPEFLPVSNGNLTGILDRLTEEDLALRATTDLLNAGVDRTNAMGARSFGDQAALVSNGRPMMHAGELEKYVYRAKIDSTVFDTRLMDEMTFCVRDSLCALSPCSRCALGQCDAVGKGLSAEPCRQRSTSGPRLSNTRAA